MFVYKLNSDVWPRALLYPIGMSSAFFGAAALCLPMLAGTPQVSEPPARASFELGQDAFLLNGRPFQIMSGEMHPARIPEEYWDQRIRMAKAMGLNTIAAYVFWNYHEPSEGKFDFKSGNHNLAKFLNLCRQEHMWVILRAGPYCCGEWDFGGIPPYLLKYPDLKVRCMDPRYISAVSRYLTHLAAVVAPLQVTHGGPILLVQLENEYGSYGNDRTYIGWLHDFWRAHGIDVPFYTSDGPTPFMLEAGSYPGCAVGLDSGGSEGDFELAHRTNPGVPVMSGETYPGWLTHFGEAWAQSSVESVTGELKYLLSNHHSFNLYVVHGGTNFGFTAGANSGGHGYEPDVTSYDYDAPINEQGRATPKYWAMRETIASHRTDKTPLPPVPDPIPTMTIPPFHLERWTSIWDNLPKPIHTPQPKPFEAMGQTTGLALYRTHLVGHKSGRLTVTDLHDWALVYDDGKFVGVLDRRAGVKSIELPPATSKTPTLDILVEGMGHINFAQEIIDRKGITDRVTLDGMTLMEWDTYQFPLDAPWVTGLARTGGSAGKASFFKGTFSLDHPADTYIDMSRYGKGYVWVNGHNLGRYWEIGPQKRLYCPAPWLKEGANDIVVLDLLKEEPATVSGVETLHE
jgi:beta-galactosidase